MQLQNYYWVFKKALPDHICDDIINYGNSKREKLALTGRFDGKEAKDLNPQELAALKSKRDSNVAWLDDNWIYRYIMPFVFCANKEAGWNFQIDDSESAQFTKYKLNQYYDWHCDSFAKPYDDPGTPHHGKIRKLSVTCQLTDGNNYSGGNLELQDRAGDNPNYTYNCVDSKNKGTIIVFPSHVWHRVIPITRGTRYSLVIWSFGDQFK